MTLITSQANGAHTISMLLGCLVGSSRITTTGRWGGLSRLQSAPVPFQEKHNAVFAAISNCRAKNDRRKALQDLHELLRTRRQQAAATQLWQV